MFELVQELVCFHRCADTKPEKKSDNISNLVFRSPFQAVDHAAFLHQVSEHHGADQRSALGSEDRSKNGDHDGKKDLRGFRYRLPHYAHGDFSFFLGRQRA